MINWKKFETENKILGLWHFLKSLVTQIELFRKIVYKTQRMENHRYFVLDSNFTFVSNEKYFEKWAFVRQKTWSQKWTFLMSQLDRPQKNEYMFLLLAVEILHAHVFLNVIFHAEHDAHSYNPHRPSQHAACDPFTLQTLNARNFWSRARWNAFSFILHNCVGVLITRWSKMTKWTSLGRQCPLCFPL